MLTWNDVLDFACNGNPAPDRRVRMTDALIERGVSDTPTAIWWAPGQTIPGDWFISCISPMAGGSDERYF